MKVIKWPNLIVIRGKKEWVFGMLNMNAWIKKAFELQSERLPIQFKECIQMFRTIDRR